MTRRHILPLLTGSSLLALFCLGAPAALAGPITFTSGSGLVKASEDVTATAKHSTSGDAVRSGSSGQDALAWLVGNGDGNDRDFPKVSLASQGPKADDGNRGQEVDGANNRRCPPAALGCGETVELPPNSLVAETWYRVVTDVKVAGESWTLNGPFVNHSAETDSTTALSNAVTTLMYTGSLLSSTPSAVRLTNPGEVGILAMAHEGVSLPYGRGGRFDGFSFGYAVPEPASLLLLGSGVLGLCWIYRRRHARHL